MNTDELLQQPPFNLTDEADRKALMHLAKDLGITLDDFLFGKVYKKECVTNPDPYTTEQLQAIVADIVSIYERTFAGREPSNDKTYTFTLGAPLVGKSFFTESKLVDLSNVYVDPDRQSLQYMNCYKVLAAVDRKLAYETYRDASNYICNLLLLWAIYKRYNIVHGTTGTNPRVAKSILPTLKNLSYKINVQVLFASPEARKSAGIHRNEHQKFYQSTPNDEKGKVAPVFARISDAVLTFADTADFYWNSGTFCLNTTQEQSDAGLRKFASFNRAKDPAKVVADYKCLDILDALCKEVVEEIPAKQEQDEIIALFRSWFVKPEFRIRNYLPAFNMRNAALVTAAVATVAVAASYMMQGTSNASKLRQDL